MRPIHSIILACIFCSQLCGEDEKRLRDQFSWERLDNELVVVASARVNPQLPGELGRFPVRAPTGPLQAGPERQPESLLFSAGPAFWLPVLLSGHDLASTADTTRSAERLWGGIQAERVAPLLRPAESPWQAIEQLIAIRVAGDHALPLDWDQLGQLSTDSIVAHAVAQTQARLSNAALPLPPLMPLAQRLQQLPRGVEAIAVIDTRYAPPWDHVGATQRLFSAFDTAMRLAVMGGQVDATHLSAEALRQEQLAALPLILAEKFGNIRIDRIIAAGIVGKPHPLFGSMIPVLCIEGVFSRQQLTDILEPYGVTVAADGHVALPFMHAHIADNVVQLYPQGFEPTVQSAIPQWFDVAAAESAYIYAAAALSDPTAIIPQPQLGAVDKLSLAIARQGEDMAIHLQASLSDPALSAQLEPIFGMPLVPMLPPAPQNPNPQMGMTFSFFKYLGFITHSPRLVGR